MDKEGQTKKSRKGLKIFSVTLLVLIAGFIAVYFMFISSSTISAQLHIESGSVFVNSQPVLADMKLSKGDIIETGSDGKATVILYESVIISLEENTQISLDSLTQKHPKVSQEKGETWNTFTKLSGVEDYSIESGNSIASVRATAFGLSENYIIGGEGETRYQTQGQEFLVLAKKVVETTNSQITERDATSQELEKIKANMERTIERLRHLRQLEIDKNPRLYNLIKSQAGYTDEELEQYLLDADDGKVNVDEIAAQSPVKLKSVNKIVGITKEIQKITSQFSEL